MLRAESTIEVPNSMRRPDITSLLQAWSEGNHAARDELFPLVYEELHGRAAAYLRRERPGHTLQPTALGTRGLSAPRGTGPCRLEESCAVLLALPPASCVASWSITRAQERWRSDTDRCLKVTLDERVAGVDPPGIDALGTRSGTDTTRGVRREKERSG